MPTRPGVYTIKPIKLDSAPPTEDQVKPVGETDSIGKAPNHANDASANVGAVKSTR